MRFTSGILCGFALAFGAPTGAAEPPGQAPYDPTPPVAIDLELGECSGVKQVDTFTVTNKRGGTRVVTKTIQNCGGGYTLVTRYKSPWVTA